MSQVVGTLAEVWRYPVKGMRGERLRAAEMDAVGMVGDRRLAFESSSAPHGKPLLSGKERAGMLLYTARLQGGVPYVVTPVGDVFAADDPALFSRMAAALPGCTGLALRTSATPQTDVRPVALLGVQTVQQLATELQRSVDARRFRANLLLRLAEPFAEDALSGRLLRIGSAVLKVLERTPRCRMVTLDPETAQPDVSLMKHLDRAHSGRVGVYAAVVGAGSLHEGDTVELV